MRKSPTIHARSMDIAFFDASGQLIYQDGGALPEQPGDCWHALDAWFEGGARQAFARACSTRKVVYNGAFGEESAWFAPAVSPDGVLKGVCLLIEHVAAPLAGGRSAHALARSARVGQWECCVAPPLDTSLPLEEQVEWVATHSFFVCVNEAQSSIYGVYQPRSIVGMRSMDLVGADRARQVIRSWVKREYGFAGEVFHEECAGVHRTFVAECGSAISEEGMLSASWGAMIELATRQDEHRSAPEQPHIVEQLLQASPGLTFLYDVREDRCMFVNQGVERLLGYPPEMLQSAALYSELAHPEDARAMRASYLEWKRGGAKGMFRVRVRARHRSGEYRHLSLRVVPARLREEESITLLIGTAVDDTELVQVLARERALVRRLHDRQKSEALGVLATGISHDFNNVLAVVCSIADMIKMTPGTEHIQEDLTLLLDAANRGRELATQIVQFSSGTSGEIGRLDLADELRRFTAMIQRVAKRHRVTLRLVDAPCVVRGNRGHLGQILMNLFTNALHAVESGGEIELNMTRGVRFGRASVQVQVRDTGCGMAPEVLARALEPYFTTRSGEDGAGIGLAVVRGLVEQHGGTLELESVRGEGTTVSVWFPLVE